VDKAILVSSPPISASGLAFHDGSETFVKCQRFGAADDESQRIMPRSTEGGKYQ
jgi:hypothetical protein